MTTYQLTIDIDNAGLTKIYNAGQYVTLVKSVVTSTTESQVAWVSFQPLQTNVVTWVENYYLYSTTTSLQSGATITMTSTSSTPVQEGWMYTFAQGQFSGVSGAGSTFNVNNQMNNASYNFGLAQQASVNNVTTFAPLNAVSVLFNQTASFTPQEIISVYLSSYSNNGTVISSVAGNACTVTLSSTSPSASLGFNDSTNTFYQESTSMLSAMDFASRLLVSR